MVKQKYVVEIVRLDGTWVKGSVWACRPNDFREFLNYMNRLCVRSIMRIKRAADGLESEFQWPLTS